MKDYYEIMKVDRKASDTEIKKAFRRLANQYHPDKNPSREAKTIFQEINEAYEVLSDPASRTEYDQRLTNPAFYTYQTVRPQPTPNYRRGPSQRTVLQNSMLRYSRLLFYFGCLWCSVLTVDYLVPEQVLEGKVLDVNASMLTTHPAGNFLVTDLGPSFRINASETRFFPPNTTVHIYRSQLLAALIRVENYNGTFVVNNLATIYRNFSFAPIMLFIACLVGLFVRGSAEFHLNLGVVVFLIMMLNIALLITSRI